MTADTFEINASPGELATMTAQLDAAEAELAGQGNASASNGRRTAEASEETAEVPGQKPNQSDRTEVKPKDSSGTRDAKETKAEQPVETPAPNEEPDAKANARPKSAYTREMERRDKSWKALNQEKQKFAAEQARLAGERLQWEQERAAALADAPQYTAAQYEHAARVFEAEGKREMAVEARAEAARLTANPPDAQKREALRQAQVSASQAKSWEQVMSEFPSIRVAGSPENAEALKIVNEDPQVWNIHPNAPLLVARMAVSRLQAARVPELETGLAKAKARIEELEKLTSPAPGGGPTDQAEAKSLDDKSLAEQEAEIRQLIRGH